MKIVAVEEDELGVILTREEAEIIAAFLFTVIAGKDTEERMICKGMSSELRNVAKVNASVFKFQKLANHPIALSIHKCN